MGTAVERLEITTAFALLLVAVFVGVAGTLAWAWEAPDGMARHVIEQGYATGDSLAQAASRAGALVVPAITSARDAAAQAVAAVNGLPGGGLGVLAALLAGALGVPLVALGARAVRRIDTTAAAWRAPASRLRRIGAAARHRRIIRRPRDTARPGIQAATQSAALPQSTSTAAEPLATLPAALEHVPEPAHVLSPAPVLPAAPARAAGDALPAQNQPSLTAVPAILAPPNTAAPPANDEDRALAAVQVTAAVLVGCGARSPVLAIDIVNNAAQVLLDLHAEDHAVLERAFAAQPLCSSQAELRWTPPSIDVRFVGDAVAGALASTLAVPLLKLGRRRVRYAPLDTWRHLGIYGGGAHAAAHHIVATILCQRRPDELGLAVLDRHGWAALYRNTPHWVDLPGDGPACADALARALRQGAAAQRGLLLVLVDPDSATLAAFTALLSRLSLQPSAPLHLLLVQRRLQPPGRQLYLALPALITAGEAAPELVPAVRRWPRAGTATVLVRGRRWAGQPFQSDEAGIGELTRRLAEYPRSALPVLWQAAAEHRAPFERPAPLAEHAVVVEQAGS